MILIKKKKAHGFIYSIFPCLTAANYFRKSIKQDKLAGIATPALSQSSAIGGLGTS